MASTDIWFPLYVGDYLADTMHLTTAEHGAFFLLLCAYYKRRGPLPDNDAFLSSTAKMTLSDWSATRSTLAGLFELRDGFWIQKRCDFEIQKQKNSQLARIKGANATNTKLGRTLSDTPSDSLSERSPCRSMVAIPQSQSESQSEVHSELKSEKSTLSGKPDVCEKAREILAYLNVMANRKFRDSKTNLGIVKARLEEVEGDTQGVKTMIDRMCKRWQGTEQQEYLQPSTLFGKEKFDNYYTARELPLFRDNQQPTKPDHKNGF